MLVMRDITRGIFTNYNISIMTQSVLVDEALLEASLQYEHSHNDDIPGFVVCSDEEI